MTHPRRLTRREIEAFDAIDAQAITHRYPREAA